MCLQRSCSEQNWWLKPACKKTVREYAAVFMVSRAAPAHAVVLDSVSSPTLFMRNSLVHQTYQSSDTAKYDLRLVWERARCQESNFQKLRRKGKPQINGTRQKASGPAGQPWSSTGRYSSWYGIERH